MWESVVVVFALVVALFLFVFLPAAGRFFRAVDAPRETGRMSGKQLPAVQVDGPGIPAHHRALESLQDRGNGSILAGGMSRARRSDDSPVCLWILIKPRGMAMIMISFFMTGILIKSTVCSACIGIHVSS
jgi:hypothetical protein